MSVRGVYICAAFCVALHAYGSNPSLAFHSKSDFLSERPREQEIIYVGWDGSGDFNCDGTADQVEINLALEFVQRNRNFTTVHLKGPHTYWINGTIYLPSDTALQGDRNAVLKLVNNARWWTKFKPLIGQKGNSGNNIKIRGFEINGNRGNQKEPPGSSYYTLIQLANCWNVTISDMFLHSGTNDLIRFYHDEPGHAVASIFYNNVLRGSGHDGIYIINVNTVSVFNNQITSSRTNSPIRITRGNHIKIYGNTCRNNLDKIPSGGPGIQIQGGGTGYPIDHVEIYDNHISGMGMMGILLFGQGNYPIDLKRDTHIYNNEILSNHQGGIVINGFHNTLVENNTIDGNYTKGGVVYEGAAGAGSGYVTVVRNNRLTNTRRSGYGLNNVSHQRHSFVSNYNCIYGNADGTYYNASSGTDIHDESCILKELFTR
jgi:parallel beta-helix repeat protein